LNSIRKKPYINFTYLEHPNYKSISYLMQSIIQGKHFLLNRTLKPVSSFNPVIPADTTSVYEVIRIAHGKILFWIDHLQRLLNSFTVAGLKPAIHANDLLSLLDLLITTNAIDEGNIKLDFHFTTSGNKQFTAYFITTNYPNKAQKTKGIHCCLQHAERHHPTAKIYNPQVRGKANSIIEHYHVYETLLVNHINCLTEGSRSNLFFIKNDELYTADDAIVLPGIIRKKVLQIAQQEDIQINYRAISIDEIEQMDAAFITGTSPRILPIAVIDKHHFKVPHPLFIKLKSCLDQLIMET